MPRSSRNVELWLRYWLARSPSQEVFWTVEVELVCRSADPCRSDIAIGIPVWAIVDAARRPASSFQQIGSDKTRWIVLIAVLSVFFNLGGVVASIVYLASARPRLQRAGSGPPDMGTRPDGLRQRQGSDILASDGDREQVTRELCYHFEMGRLTVEELNDRLDVTLRARTVGDLFAVIEICHRCSHGHELARLALRRLGDGLDAILAMGRCKAAVKPGPGVRGHLRVKARSRPLCPRVSTGSWDLWL